jgi:mitotic spindle assembly checkpoint protein MAD2B
MPPPPDVNPEPNIEEDSLSLDHAHILLTSFNSFLTVAIHNILYYRNIYPRSTFLAAKAYNLPVHQNRHPKVCAWIRDAVDAVAAQLSTGHVSRIAIVIHSPLEPSLPPFSLNPSPTQDSPTPTPSSPPPPSPSPSQEEPPTVPPGAVLERWLISTPSLPTWPTPKSKSTTTTNPTSAKETSKAMSNFSRILTRDARSEQARERHLGPDPLNPSFAWVDLDEQLRGALRRMASVAEGMEALPEGCTFTVAVELDEEGRAPIGVSFFFLTPSRVLWFA